MRLEFEFVKPEVFDLAPVFWCGFDPQTAIELQPHWTMANLAVEMGIFPSVSQARRNGWDGPIPEGYTERTRIGKMNRAMYIFNPPDIFFEE